MNQSDLEKEIAALEKDLAKVQADLGKVAEDLALRANAGPAPGALTLGAGMWIVIGGAAWLVANRRRRS